MIWEKFKNNIRDYGLIKKNDSVLICVSGGPDSVCLLYLLLKLKKQLGFTVAVVYFNHGLRAVDAEKEAVFVQKLSDRHKLPCHIISLPVVRTARRKKLGIEETARTLRYKHLHELSIKYKYNRIATAHHLDDQAETVLYRIMRGTGTRGLAGIPYKRSLAGHAEIIRPLINVSKKEILRYLKCNRMPFKLDKSNKLNIYARNRIRNNLLPYLEKYNPQIKRHLAQLAETMRGEEEYWSKKIGLIGKKLIVRRKFKFFLDLPKFNKYHIMIRKRLIRFIFQDNLDYVKVASIVRLADSQTGKKVSVPGFGFIEKSYQKLIFHPELKNADRHNGSFTIHAPGVTRLPGLTMVVKSRLLKKKPARLKSSSTRAYFDWDKLKVQKLYIRFRRKGDRFYPYGMIGSKKLKNFFVDQHVPQYKRGRIPLVCGNDGIIWVVGFRTDDRWKVDEKTKKILEIKIDEK